VGKSLLDFKSVILYHRITKDFVAGLVDLFARGLVITAGQFDFQVFTDVDRADIVVPHMGQGALHRFALGVNNRFFWCDNYFGFHVITTAGFGDPSS